MASDENLDFNNWQVYGTNLEDVFFQHKLENCWWSFHSFDIVTLDEVLTALTEHLKTCEGIKSDDCTQAP